MKDDEEADRSLTRQAGNDASGRSGRLNLRSYFKYCFQIRDGPCYNVFPDSDPTSTGTRMGAQDESQDEDGDGDRGP